LIKFLLPYFLALQALAALPQYCRTMGSVELFFQGTILKEMSSPLPLAIQWRREGNVVNG